MGQVPTDCDFCPHCGQEQPAPELEEVSDDPALALDLSLPPPPSLGGVAALAPGNSGLEAIPDIELPQLGSPPPQRAPARARAKEPVLSLDGGARAPGKRASMPPVAEPPGLSGLDEIADPGIPLEVDAAPLPSQKGRGGPSVGVSRSVRPGPVGGSKPPGRTSVRPPAARPQELPEEGSVPVDSFEVERLAAYGPPPQFLWEAPVYAWRVYLRRRDLQAGLSGTQRSEAEAAAALGAVLLRVVEEHRAELEADVHCGRLFAPYHELFARLSERRRLLDEATAVGAAEAARTEAELIKAEAALSEFRAVVNARKEETAKLYLVSKQAEATSPGEAGAAREALEWARKEQGDVEQQAQDALAQVTELRRRRKAAEMSEAEETRVLAQGLAHAREALKAPLRELAPGLTEVRPALRDDAWAEVESAIRAHERARVRQATLEQALKAYDASKVRQGVLVVVGAVALLVLMLAFGVIRMRPAEASSDPPGASTAAPLGRRRGGPRGRRRGALQLSPLRRPRPRVPWWRGSHPGAASPPPRPPSWRPLLPRGTPPSLASPRRAPRPSRSIRRGRPSWARGST
jgi:hypothetical protein